MLQRLTCSLIFGVRSQFRCAAPAGRAKGVANLGSDLKNARSRIRIRIRIRSRIQSPNAVWQSRAAQRQADQGSCLSEPQASLHETPLDASSAGNRAATLTSACLFFPYFLLAKQKTSESPAAATERHRSSSKHPLNEKEHGSGTLSPNEYFRAVPAVNMSRQSRKSITALKLCRGETSGTGQARSFQRGGSGSKGFDRASTTHPLP